VVEGLHDEGHAPEGGLRSVEGSAVVPAGEGEPADVGLETAAQRFQRQELLHQLYTRIRNSIQAEQFNNWD
jgi:hypothetical protein